MNSIIKSSILTLEKCRYLLLKLSVEELSNASITPYNSSIGSHIRHILDFYDSSLKLNSNGKVDLTTRKRDLNTENCCIAAIEYLNSTIKKLSSITFSLKKTIIVIDDLGSGKIEIDYTYAALLSQANSHTIHHYAIIGYILDRLGVLINDVNLGYNPTTPREKRSNANYIYYF